jgi:hypothetical protein
MGLLVLAVGSRLLEVPFWGVGAGPAQAKSRLSRVTGRIRITKVD